MIELSPSAFHKVTPIFGTIDHSIAIVYAVLEKNSPGRVFVDAPDTPSVNLLYAEGAFYYVGGDENSEALTQALVLLLFDQIQPRRKIRNWYSFLFPLPGGRPWIGCCRRRV